MTEHVHPTEPPYDEHGRPRATYQPGAGPHHGGGTGETYGWMSYTTPTDGSVPTSGEDRGWAVAAHVAPLVATYLSAGLLGFLAPLIIWAIVKDDKPFARRAAAGAFNFNCMITLVSIVAGILAVVTLGVGLLLAIPLWAVAGIGALICHVLGTVKAAQGQQFRYPLQLPILS